MSFQAAKLLDEGLICASSPGHLRAPYSTRGETQKSTSSQTPIGHVKDCALTEYLNLEPLLEDSLGGDSVGFAI